EAVIPLFSPPGLPAYNGACEAGIGSLKTRTERRATMAGRPRPWTAHQAAAAVAEANETSRPHGPHQPAPGHSWQARQPLSREARVLFGAALARQRVALRAEQGVATEAPQSARAEAHLERQAIRRALGECGYLT